jgi:polar amino acid transport system substrate-binding protein
VRYLLSPWRYAVLAVVLIILVIAIFSLFFLPRDDGTLAEIRRRGSLRVGLDASFPPFESMTENGQIVGIDVDIARAVAADLGVELELVNIGFDGLYDALLAHRVDLVISGLPYDPRWTQDVAYTSNYFNAGQILVTQAGEPTITTVEDVAGQIVAIEWGSQAEMEGRRLAQRLQGVTLLRRETADEALAALLAGEADAAVVDAVSGVRAFPRGLRIVAYLTEEWYAAAVHIESQELLMTVNQSLSHLSESGELAKIQARWLHGN